MKRILWGFLLVLLLCGLGFAAGDAFQKLKTNGTGKLTQEELDAAAVQAFREADKNGDGVLDPSEFNQLKGAQSSFESLDANKDGKIDMNEIRQAAAAKFGRRALNHKGALDDMESSPNRRPAANPLFSVYF